MPAMYNQMIGIWQDVNNRYCTSFFALQDQSSFTDPLITAVATAAQACSVARLIAIQKQQTIILGGYPSSGVYGSVYDRATWIAKTGTQTQAFLVSVPGPDSAIFESDTVTVDPTNTNVIALESAVLACLGNPSGDAFISMENGRRQRVKNYAA